MTDGLSLRAFGAGYPGRRVISHLELPAVPSGELVALVGPNGAGKSTLLRAIAGLLPSEGVALLDGTDLATLPTRERRLRASYLPQALPQPTALLGYESMLAALRASLPTLSAPDVEARIAGTLQGLGLHELALRRLDQLSGGQRQIMGLAQLLARQPRLLLLDEPTSALDLRWQLRVLDAVRAQAAERGAIVLVALHDLNLAMRACGRMLVLGPGGFAASGRPAELIDGALLRRVWGVEARVERCSQGHPLVLADRAIDSQPHPEPGDPP